MCWFRPYDAYDNLLQFNETIIYYMFLQWICVINHTKSLFIMRWKFVDGISGIFIDNSHFPEIWGINCIFEGHRILQTEFLTYYSHDASLIISIETRQYKASSILQSTQYTVLRCDRHETIQSFHSLFHDTQNPIQKLENKLFCFNNFILK